MLPDDKQREIAPPSAALIRRTPKIHMPAVENELRARGYLTSSVDRGGACLYRRRNGPIGAVVLAPYSSPLFDSTKPLIWRWRIDLRMVQMPARSYPDLGLDPPRARRRQCYWHRPNDAREGLELSCLPGELAALAVWLPAWIAARDRGVPHPECPVAMSRHGLVKVYAWTAFGEIASDDWERAELARQRACELARAERELARAARERPPAPVEPAKLHLIIGGLS